MDTAKADADLDKISAKVKALEDGRHVIKISAVFDDASVSRARTAFASLDNAISRDAMQRLRSSPQGSVLGALNALFSPHPVSGAPSPQQAASQGLLGKIFGPQGGGTTSMPGSTGSSSSTSTNVVRDVVTGQSTTQPGTATEQVKLVQQGAAPSPGTGTEKVKLEADTSDLDRESKDAASKSGDDAGKSWTGKFGAALAGGGITAAIGRIFGGGGGGIKDTAAKAGDSAGAAMGAGLLGGIGPGITGVSAKMGLITAAAGTALAALPALAGLIGTGMGVAMVGGLVAAAVATSPQLKAEFKSIGSDAKNVLTQAAAPIIPAFSKVLSQVPALIKSLEPALAGIFKTVAPQLQSVYAGLVPIVHGLVSIAQAAAPAFGPFITAIEKLVSSLLPGIAIVIRATVPVLSQFGQIMGTLGRNLGGLFSAAAPAIKASMTVLGALLGAVGGLLPVLVKLGDVFATALAPVITAFAGTIKSLTPVLSIIGNVVAQLAGAVLGDLVSAFTALAALLTDIAPALTTFAKSLGIVFTTMENSGVFAILGDAIEALAGPLATMISALLNGLAPILPPIFTAIGQIAGILAGGLAAGIAAVLPALTTLATTALQGVADLLPVVLPLLTTMTKLFTGALVIAIKGAAIGLDAVVKALPPDVLGAIAIALAGIVISVKALNLGKSAFGGLQSMVKTLKGLLTLGSDKAATAPEQMQKAGDTMADAAAAMNKAADKMAGADAGAAEGGAAGAAEGGAAAEEGAAIGATLLKGGLIIALAAALTEAVIKPFLSSQHIPITNPQPGQNPTGNWWNNPAHANPLSPNPKDQGLSTWAGLGTIIKGWLGFGQSGQPPRATPSPTGKPSGAQQLTMPVPDPNAGEMAWTKWWQDFDKDFIHPMAAFFDTTVPGYFTSVGQYVAQGAIGNWNAFYGGFIKPVADFFTSTLPGFFSSLAGSASPVGAWLGTLGDQIGGFFTKTLPGWFSTALGVAQTFFTSTLPAPFTTFWGWLQGWGSDIGGFFTKTVPGFFSSLGRDAADFFTSTLPAPFKTFWSWVQGWGGDIDTLFTKTLPGFFSDAVSDIGKAWSGLESAVAGPVNTVINDVLNPLIGAFDTITKALGLGSPIPKLSSIGGGGSGGKQTSKARHGMKVPGWGGGDIFPALLEPGETVVSKEKSKEYAWLFKSMGVPGYAQGGVIPGPLGHVVSDATHAIGSVVSGAIDVGKILAAIVTGNSTALTNALGSLAGKGTGATGILGEILGKLPHVIVTDMVDYIMGSGVGKGGAGVSGGGSMGGPVAAGVAQAQAYAKSRLGAFGWGASAMSSLIPLWDDESGWNRLADNPSSGAYGIPQALPASKMGAAANPPTSSAAAQINWGLPYIQAVYGSPAGALQHENAYHWYGNGGVIPEPVTGFGQRSGRVYRFGERGPETVVPGGGSDLAKEIRALRADFNSLTKEHIAVSRAVPRATGEHVGDAIGGAAHAASFRNRFPRGGA